MTRAGARRRVKDFAGRFNGHLKEGREMKQIRLALITCLLAGVAAASFADAGPGAAAQGMERLKTLVGTWEGKGPEGMPITVTFKLTGEDSTLMEHLSLGDMITMYHQDGDQLMLTHYCAGNNQPRMRAAGLSADGKSIAFRFHDVTNLSSPGASHMKSLTITFDDADHISEEWTHLQGGKDAPMKIHLTRVK
jgi:hypothetical protein